MNRLLLAATALAGLSACVPVDAAAYKFCPGGKQVRKNAPCPNQPSFAVQDATVAENAGSATVTVLKTGTATNASTINYATTQGTAIAGVNYKPVSASATLTAAQTSFSFTVPVIDDGKTNPTLTLGVKLTAVTNATIARNGIVYITDTDNVVVPTPTPTQTCPDGSVIPATSACPAAPPPTPPPGSADTTSLIAPLADIPDNFTTSTTLRTTIETVPASLDPAGAFRFTCFSGQLLKDDPIVYPGQPGKSHLHLFFGNTGTNASSTYQSLRTTGGSTCTHDSAGTPLSPTPQRTAYWMPAMLDGAGNAVKADFMLTYYKQLPASSPENGFPDATSHVGIVTPLPNDLKFIYGYNMTTGLGGPATTDSSPGSDAWRMGYDCVVPDGTGVSYTGPQHTIADIVATGKCPVGAWLRVAITLPDCWDGVHTDTADHRSHMVPASGAGMFGRRACPADHPYNIPEIAIQAFFTTDANFAAGKWHLASDEMVPGAPAGSTLHFDYWEAWSPVVKNMWKTGCIDGHFSCNAGELGNGQSIAGMNGNFSDIPNHILVPLSTIP